MNIKKYFWGLNPKAVAETEKIIKNSSHPRYPEKMFIVLSRCDKPKELFSFINKKRFVEDWPKIRRFWIKKKQAEDFRAWWETVYEELIEREGIRKSPRGRSPEIFKNVGEIIRNKRIENGLSQKDMASKTWLRQPDISKIEQGRVNVTLETLVRICKVLDIRNIPLIVFPKK